MFGKLSKNLIEGVGIIEEVGKIANKNWFRLQNFVENKALYTSTVYILCGNTFGRVKRIRFHLNG